MPNVHLAKPGEDPIDVYGDAPAPKARLAGCVGPALVIALLVFLGAKVAPMLAAPEPTPLPEAAALPTVTPTATATGTQPPTPTMRPSSTLPPTYTPTLTHTPSPTWDPTWTPTGTRIPWVGGVVANAPELNVRAGPGRSYPRLSVLSRGAAVVIVAREPGGTWAKIESPIAGWVHMSYITPDRPEDVVWLPIVTDPPLVN